MALVRIKGHDIVIPVVKDSFNRRALQFKNNICELLSKIGVVRDDIDIPWENAAFKKAPASVSWYFDGHNLHYSYDMCSKFVENLYMVQKVLEIELEALAEGDKTLDEFIAEFREEEDVVGRRKEARETLGVGPDEKDINVIDKAFKTLAKEHHPDKPNGDTAKFKEINKAHKILKRELT